MGKKPTKTRLREAGKRPMHEVLQTGIAWEAIRASYFIRHGSIEMAEQAESKQRNYQQLLDEYLAELMQTSA